MSYLRGIVSIMETVARRDTCLHSRRCAPSTPLPVSTLIRNGDSMHVIRMSGGMVKLIPASSWHWEGGHNPDSWTARVTCYGPSTSTTWNLPASAVVFVRWGGTPGQPYVGTGPLSWARTTARL